MVAEALTLTGSIHDYPVVPECDLNVHLSKLLESGNLSDVTLAVGDREFKAHKALLAGERGFPYSGQFGGFGIVDSRCYFVCTGFLQNTYNTTSACIN